jgi:hypothetical protein
MEKLEKENTQVPEGEEDDDDDEEDDDEEGNEEEKDAEAKAD